MPLYQPDQWKDFFFMVGGGAAALAGLVFVAMSIHLKIITEDPTHRYRARGTLAGFTAVFLVCGLALMGGQNHVAVGLEWLLVASVAAYIYLDGYRQAKKEGGSPQTLTIFRVIGGTSCYAAQIAGALAFSLGYVAGLYAASFAMLVFFVFMISGAWLLVVGIYQEHSVTKLKR